MDDILLRRMTGGRYSIAVSANGALAIVNPLAGIIPANVRPELSFGIESIADPGAVRFWIDDGAGGAVDWRVDATFTVNVGNYAASPFTLYVNVRLPHGGFNRETVGTGVIVP